MTFVNGEVQARFMARIRGVDPQRCLAIPVDVGKATAVALVADHYGEIIVAPFEFALTEAGFAVLSAAITRAQVERDALVVRIGVEAAGHYHRTLVARLRAAGLEVVELNPKAVKDARGQQLLRTLKSDARDCGAMAELLIRGSGRPPQCRDEALAAQAAWVAHRRRKVAAQVMLSNQIHGQLDLIFPGLTGCFANGLDAASLRVLIRDLPDPDRVRRLGLEGVLRFVRRRGVRMSRPKAAQVVQAAQQALRLPGAERPAPLVVLAADWALFEALDQQIEDATTQLAALLPDTPAGVLLSVPGVGVLTARPEPLPRRRGRLPGLRPGPDQLPVGRPHPTPHRHQPRRIGRIAPSHRRIGPRRRPAPPRFHHLPAQAAVPRQAAAGRHDRRRPPRAPARVRHAAQPAAIRRRPLGASRRRPPPPHRRAGPSWRHHRARRSTSTT
jgi:transposase